MKSILSLLALAAFTPEAAFNPFVPSTTQSTPLSSRYQDCIAMLEEDVEIGRIAASQWVTGGGGAPAQHCLAIADLRAGFPKLAAVRLTELTERKDAGDGLIRARYLEQASMAWLEAEEPGQALDTIKQAQILAPNSGELSLTAGLIYAKNEQWQATINSIDAAQAQGFQSVASLIARGNAFKALTKYREAADDVVAALSIDPFHLDALVLRGELQQLGVAIEANYQRAPG